MSIDSPSRAFQSASSSNGFLTSREMLITYIKNLSRQDISKLLTPVKDGLLTENTILHMNTINFSVDHVVVPITVKELLDELGPKWKKWILTVHGPEDHEDINFHRVPHHHPHADDVSSVQVLEYIKDLGKHQKRSMLNLVREGILTDECFINVSDMQSPERVQIPMPRVIDTLTEAEQKFVELHELKPLLLRIAYGKHYSSASFENLHRSDLDVRSLSPARFTMPIWYTVLWMFMTLGTFASQIWSQATNYQDMQNALNLTTPTILLIVSSLAIAVLLYLTIYMIAFLCCCENNLWNRGLVTKDLNYGALYTHFCELNRIEIRIYTTKALQFGLLWYSMVLSIYAHEHNLNIYPALLCLLTNAFGLQLFARIGQFFRTCRRTRHGTAIAAR